MISFVLFSQASQPSMNFMHIGIGLLYQTHGYSFNLHRKLYVTCANLDKKNNVRST